MTNATLKKEVLEFIDNSDILTLRMVHAMLKAKQQYDFWDDLPLNVKTDIEDALVESSKGLGKSHELVMKKYSKWRSK